MLVCLSCTVKNQNDMYFLCCLVGAVQEKKGIVLLHRDFKKNKKILPIKQQKVTTSYLVIAGVSPLG